MRTLFIVVGAIVAVSCGRTVDVEQDRAALLAVDRVWATTVKDADTFMSYLAPDAVMQLHGMPELRTAKDIRTIITAMQGAPGFALSWQPRTADVSGDIGYTTGAFQLTEHNSAGTPVTAGGKYTTVWKKIDGRWKATVDALTTDTPTPVSSPHVMIPPSKLTWNNGPPTLPAGTRIALLSGDPSGPGHFTVRVQFPAGARVPPHWHPNDEHVTVLSGTLAVGMGKTWDDTAMTDLAAGSYVVTSATMVHYALAKAPTTIQVSGMGPFVTNYVNPADDPSRR